MSQADDIEACFAEAVAFHQRGRFADAAALYESVIMQSPGIGFVHSNLGAVLWSLDRCEEALPQFERAVALAPDNAQGHNNLGNAFAGLKRCGDAVACFDRALALDPGYAEAHYNKGNALKNAMRPGEAIRCYDRAIALKPDFAAAWNNRGNALKDLNRWDEAVTSYETALAGDPDIECVPGALLYAKMRVCDYAGLDDRIAMLAQGIRRGQKMCTPFQLLAMSGDPALQLQAAEIHASAWQSASGSLPDIGKRAGGEKIRLGYFSADFHDHATMHLMGELFEHHDRSKFELFAFSFGPDRDDDMRARLGRAVGRFIDVKDLTDRDVARLSRNLGVDVAIDLKGFTQDGRTGIFACRAAPVQVSYLGYPGTMGASFIDYIVADTIVIPEGCTQYYREKIVRLPHSYQVNDRKRAASVMAPSRAEQGLPEDGFVFCCFNNNYKITPSAFDGWMRILGRVDGSVLWLLEDNATAARNLRREAIARGVDGGRLIFAPRRPSGEHLARLRLADLFLDTYPYNAHTTASEALWMGLPVVTLAGEAFASRVAASLLHATDMAELVTTNPQAYEALACDLARSPERLAALKKKLVDNRLTTPLFDSKRFTRDFEAACTAMFDRHQRGLAPDDIHVAA